MNKNLVKTILYTGIPALIAIIVFFIPSWIQEIFVLKMNHLTWWNWFTYIFVHENLPHLIRNLIFYAFSIITAYFICPKDYKKDFYKPFLIIFFLTPIISLIVTFLVWKFGGILLLNHRGFSGITSASIGLLGFLIAKRIYVLWKVKNKLLLLQLSYFVFIPSLAVMVWNLSKTFFFFILALGILMTFNLVIILKKEKITIDNSQWSKKEIITMIIALSIFFFGALLLVPEKLINEGGSVVNTLSHLIGFVIGFWTYFIWDLKRIG